MSLRHVLSFGVAATALALTTQAYAGVNLVVNGDFSAGNTGFSSDYHYVAQPASPSTGPGVPPAYTSWNEQTYGVGANAALYHSLWPNLLGPGGSGDYMIVNGATRQPAPGTFKTVWEQSVSVTPGATYDFSAEIASIISANPAKLNVFANGVQIAPTYTAGPSAVWDTFSTILTVGSVTNIDLSVQDANLAASGNDFGLASISLTAVPEPSTWAMLGLGAVSLALGYRSRRQAISIV